MIVKRNDALYQQIISYFEDEIMQGRLKPGDRIPSTTRLSEMFKVTPDTVQQGLKTLAERGFISRTPGCGTFVRRGINTRTLGIIFKRTLFTDEDVSFYSGFLSDLIVLAEQEQWNCRLFMITDNQSSTDASGDKGLLDLKKAVAEGEIRAVIEFCSNSAVQKYLKEECPVPVSFSMIGMDCAAFAEEGIAYLRERGFRNIGIIANHVDSRENYKDAILRLNIHNGLKLNYFEANDANQTEGYRLMREFYENTPELPEALMVTNDRLFVGVWYFLLEKGIRVPQDIALLTHANKGRLPMSHVPLTRLEVDPIELTREVFTEIAERIAGRNYEIQPVKARFVAGKSCGEC